VEVGKSIARAPPAVVVSASALTVSVSEAKAAGAVDCLAKPIRLTKLLKLLELKMPVRQGQHFPVNSTPRA
jgi:CheY-like chemotaxis protein